MKKSRSITETNMDYRLGIRIFLVGMIIVCTTLASDRPLDSNNADSNNADSNNVDSRDVPTADESSVDDFDMAAWTTKGPAEHWRIDDEYLVGENPDKKGSILWTKKPYTNFVIELDYRTPSEDYDSGVFARGKSHQVQIGISRSLKRDMTGCIYAPVDKQGGYPGQTDIVAKHHKLGEWNHLKVVVQENRIKTMLNGQEFVDYQAKKIPESGPIGLQLHGGVHMKMIFKNIQIREIKSESK